MIKENQKLLNNINIITDVIIAIASIIMSYMLIFHLLDFEKNFALIDYIKLAVVFAPIQLMTFGCLGLYDSFRTKAFTTELGKLLQALIIDGVFMVTILYVLHLFNFSRWALFTFLALDFVLAALKRLLMRRILRKMRAKGYNQKRVLVIGGGSAARDYIHEITGDKSYGLVCAGYISDTNTLECAERLGGFEDMAELLEREHFDEAVCALDDDETDWLSQTVEACEHSGTKLSVIPIIYRFMSVTTSIDVVGSIPLMNIRRIPLDNIGNAFLKRTMDIVGSAVLLVLTSPIILISMLIIKLTMGGSPIFKQKRVGLNKKLFTMYKLKSMKDSDCSDTAWSTDADPRKTRFGAFIRKLSIDELPQLVNVLKGDMSLVGPRPEVPFYVDEFKNTIPMYMIKHQVKPGITGLAQIKGLRGDTSIEKRIEYDIRYIENWSFFLDISILLQTLFKFTNSEKLSKKDNAGDAVNNIPERIKND